MTIHVVERGETIGSIAAGYGVDAAWLAACNAVPADGTLVPGQTLTIRVPDVTHTVREGDTLTSVAAAHGVTVRDLWRRNWPLGGRTLLRPGQILAVTFRDERPLGPAVSNGYAYPWTDPVLLDAELPYLTDLSPFTYGIGADGSVLPLRAAPLREAARLHGTRPLMHLSTLTEDGGFDTARAAPVLTDPAVQDRLTEDLLRIVEEDGYGGADVDFEYLSADLAGSYAAFLRRLRRELSSMGRTLWAALAPKVRADQPGLLYEGHDYAAVGAATDAVLLMTYEWGYTYGPPMAVSPLPGVRAVLSYALTEIPAEKILLGISNYGYDWPLPYVRGVTRARSISPQGAVALAASHGAEIQYDQTAQAPFFRYTDGSGTVHEVWTEDARSLDARLRLIAGHGLKGCGIWRLGRPYPQIWQVLDALYRIA